MAFSEDLRRSFLDSSRRIHSIEEKVIRGAWGKRVLLKARDGEIHEGSGF